MAKLGKPNETIEILKKYNFNFQKKFGQNFLIDTHVLDKIIKAADITKKDVVLEIGPGIGTLTQTLLENAGHVVAVEIDRNLIPILENDTLAEYDNKTIINADVLELDLEKVLAEACDRLAETETDEPIQEETEIGTDEASQEETEIGTDEASQEETEIGTDEAMVKGNETGTDETAPEGNEAKKKLRKGKVVANLPYYITTPIIMGLLEKRVPLDNITVMVQKEVALRMQAAPGSKDYGALSLAVQYYSKPYLAANVPPNCFIPRPNVGSAVIRLDIYDEPPVKVMDEKHMFAIIRAAFNQRRKTLVNSVKNYSELNYSREEIETALSSLGYDVNIRGEALGLADFAAVSDSLMQNR